MSKRRRGEREDEAPPGLLRTAKTPNQNQKPPVYTVCVIYVVMLGWYGVA